MKFYQKKCTSQAPGEAVDPSPWNNMNILSEKRCNYELDLNLQAEQKDADWFKNKEKYSQVSHQTKSLAKEAGLT